MSFSDDFHDMINIAKHVFDDDNDNKEKKEVKAKKTIQLECPYCGSKNRIAWEEGVLPRCPNCGGNYEISAADLKRMAAEQQAPAPDPSLNARPPKPSFFEKNRILIIAVVIVIVLAIAGGLFAAISGSKDIHMKGDATFELSVGKTADSSEAVSAP